MRGGMRGKEKLGGREGGRGNECNSVFISSTSMKHLIFCLHNYCSPLSFFDRNNTFSSFCCVVVCYRAQCFTTFNWLKTTVSEAMINCKCGKENCNKEKKKKTRYLFLKLCSNYHLRQLFLVCSPLLDVAAKRDPTPLC